MPPLPPREAPRIPHLAPERRRHAEIEALATLFDAIGVDQPFCRKGRSWLSAVRSISTSLPSMATIPARQRWVSAWKGLTRAAAEAPPEHRRSRSRSVRTSARGQRPCSVLISRMVSMGGVPFTIHAHFKSAGDSSPSGFWVGTGSRSIPRRASGCFARYRGPRLKLAGYQSGWRPGATGQIPAGVEPDVRKD